MMQPAVQQGLATVRYVIDPATSRFTLRAFATGLLSAFGHNPTIALRDYDGEIQFTPDTFDKGSVRVTVQMDAMEVLDEMKADDRRKLEQTMFDEVLKPNQFPTAVYQGNKVAIQRVDGSDLLQVHVVGELSFHGVTQAHSVAGRVTPMGNVLRISGEFPLRQSDYGITPVSFAAGALRLKDELKFKFDLVARAE
jgi:polyisoprenoid-binding protein YceI